MSTPDHSTLVPSNKSVSYPRALLLGIYTAAIEQGFVWVNDVPQADYTSLKMQLQRLRRRSDKSNSSFITPQHHLCTIGAWEPGPGGRGRFPVMFDKMPDERPMPSLTSASGAAIPISTATAHAPIPPPPPPAAPVDTPLPASSLTESDMQLDPGSIDDYVARMMQSASKREQH